MIKAEHTEEMENDCNWELQELKEFGRQFFQSLSI